MASGVSSARDEVLNGIRTALGRRPGEPAPPVPPTARVPARVPGSVDDEITLLLGEIDKLGGRTRRLEIGHLRDALVELIQAEMIRKATLWRTTELQALGVPDILEGLGVEIVSSQAGKTTLAQCDLGVTGVDMALPDTGTLVLRAYRLSARVQFRFCRGCILHWCDRPRCASDLATVLREMRVDPYSVFVTGPSRTADIELTVTIGVHGRRCCACGYWSCEGWHGLSAWWCNEFPRSVAYMIEAEVQMTVWPPEHASYPLVQAPRGRQMEPFQEQLIPVHKSVG